MTLLKDNNSKSINTALLSLEADIKKLSNNNNFDAQLADINKRIDEINKGDGGSTEADIKNLKNDVIAINSDIDNIESDITTINTNIDNIESDITTINSDIDNIEQQLSNIFTAKNKVTDFNTTTNSGIYYWTADTTNKPGTNYGVLLVNKYVNGGSIWISQIAYGIDNRIYFRQNINSGNWTVWKAVAFEGSINADTVDNYHASQLWRSDGATWNPSADVTMTPSGNGDEWSFDFRNKNGATGIYWHVWDENKKTLLRVDADSGKVSAPYGFVGNLSGAKLTLQGDTVSSNSYTDTNPKLEFKNIDGSQNISLTFTDYDAVQAPASLTLNGNQGNEYFIAPNAKINNNLTLPANTSANLGTYGKDSLSIGFPSGTGDGKSLGFDRNSIQARTNGSASYMYINYYGGMVVVNELGRSDGGLKVKHKMIIPIGAPSQLEDGCIWIER